MSKLVLVFPLVLVAVVAWGDATIPTTDRQSSQDHPLLPRFQGSLIVGYKHQNYAEATLPVSPLVLIPNKRDPHNNRSFEPTVKKSVSGPYTRIVYLIPEDRSPIEVLRNYQQEIRGKNGHILFECKAEGCGGSPIHSSYGGGGDMSLSMYLFPEDEVGETFSSNGWCAVSTDISDQHYFVGEIPAAGAYIAVQTYSVNSALTSVCKAFDHRTMAVVYILEGAPREQSMTRVTAEDMAQQIGSSGSVALYFDFNDAEIKPDSAPTLEQIAALLKNNPTLKLLVVGHTDNIGSFASNMDLSQRRAAAVVDALSSTFHVNGDRLTPVGVSFASPIASNKTEEGRAKNRRVQLVEY